jgi:hypothetical protein
MAGRPSARLPAQRGTTNQTGMKISINREPGALLSRWNPGCPTLATFLSLWLGWDRSKLHPPAGPWAFNNGGKGFSPYISFDRSTRAGRDGF